MKKNRAVLFVLLFSILLSMFSFNSAAFTDDEEIFIAAKQPELYGAYNDVTQSKGILASVVDIEEIKDYLLENISQCNAIVDISGFGIPINSYTYLSDYIFYYLPEAFNVEKFSFSYVGNTLISIEIKYSAFADTKEEYSLCREKLLKVADRLLKDIEGNSSLSDVQKALLLHDRLALWTEYSYNDLSKEKHSLYGALVQRAAVCQGYAMAYMYLLERVGIESLYCSSFALNHAWNIVYIDSVPYHVDVTWDDVSWGNGEKGASGAVKHTNFLRSTKGIKKEKHTANDFSTLPSDGRYDEYFWQNSQTGFRLVDNEIYYLDSENEQIRKYGESKNLCTVSGKWHAGNGSFWIGNFARLDSADGKLLYSLPDGIYEYSIKEKSSKKIFSQSVSDYYSVYGFRYEDGYIYYEINKAPPGSETLFLKEGRFAYGNYTPEPEKIEINKKPSKTEYFIGDKLDLKGLSLKLKFADGSSTVVTSGFNASGFSSSSAGTKTVTVSYKGLKASFDVKVSVPYVKLSEKNVTVESGLNFPVHAESVPSGQKITWKSSSEKNAKVNNGVITAALPGKAVVTAEFTYNGVTYKQECSINVLEAASSAVFKDSKNAKMSKHGILSNNGLTVKELLQQTEAGAEIRDKNKNLVSETAVIGTGMTLVLPNGMMYTIIVFGDTDGDGKVIATDARLVLRASVNLEHYDDGSAEAIAANVADGPLNASDARLILRASVNLENTSSWMK